MSYRFWMILSLLPMVTGCVPLAGQWDVASLAERHPGLLDSPTQRLGDTTPYFIPRGNSALLFLCHFPRRSTISVSLPADATALEQASARRLGKRWTRDSL